MVFLIANRRVFSFDRGVFLFNNKFDFTYCDVFRIN